MYSCCVHILFRYYEEIPSCYSQTSLSDKCSHKWSSASLVWTRRQSTSSSWTSSQQTTTDINSITGRRTFIACWTPTPSSSSRTSFSMYHRQLGLTLTPNCRNFYRYHRWLEMLIPLRSVTRLFSFSLWFSPRSALVPITKCFRCVR